MSRAAPIPKQVQTRAATASGHDVRRRVDSLSDMENGPALPRFGGSLAALPALPQVQRKCAQCEEEEKQQSEVQPSLEVGPAGDRFEREADAIAAETLALPAPAAAPVASPGPALVQRRCAACEDETPRARRVSTDASSTLRRKCAACEAEDKEEAVRPKRAKGDATRITASGEQLTSGGRPLSGDTRDFFESRMGRDLSGVRVHDGGESERLNGSISARAFTYGSHIWLGRGERADTGFTMAHELAHVLQQTQPSVLDGAGPVASPAGPAVQRLGELRTFWLPEGMKKSALSQHSVIHDKAADAMARENGSKNLIREAPIPGANAGAAAVGAKGFADLYESNKNNTIGIQETKAAQAPGSNANPVRHFSPKQRKKATIGKSLAAYDHKSSRAPKLNAKGDLVDMDKAATRIRIADMKPGHNTSARAEGVGQMNNYVSGISGVVKAANTKLPGGTGWTCDVAVMEKGGLKPPATWEPDVAGVKKKGMKLRLHKNGKPVFHTKAKQAKKDPTTGVTGNWIIAEDNVNQGIWTYLLLPDQASLDTALADPGTTKRFEEVQRKLKERVIDKLLAKPKPQPQPRRRQAASTSDRKVRRAPPKGAAKPKLKDNFDFAAWNKSRMGSSDKDLSGFRGFYHDRIPAADRDIAEFQKDVMDSVKLMETNYRGVSRHVKGEQRIKDQAARLRRFNFWISPAGAVLGRLRQIFGSLFIKVVELGGLIKEKVAAAFKKFQFDGAKNASGLKATAMKVGAKVLKIVGGIILTRTVKAITDCIAKGVTDTLKKLVEGTPIEELELKIKEIEAFVTDAEAKVVGQITSMVESILGPMQTKLKDLAKDAAFIAELVGTAKQIMNAIRIGACIVGGVESFGLACAVALGDFLLSLFDVSPTDAIAEKLLESCDAQKMMADFLGASDFITSLPNVIAQGLVERVRPLLPSWAQGLICDPKDMVVERYRPSDFQCGRNGGASGEGEAGTGGGGGTGPGTGAQKGGSGSGTRSGGGGTKGGGGSKGGGKKDGGGATKSGSSGAAGDKKKGESGDQDINTTTPKPIPPNFKKTHDKIHKFLPVSGFPKKEAFTPGMPATVTMLFVDDSSGTPVPIVEVQDIKIVVVSMGEADEHGIYPYEFTFQEAFYVEELNARFDPPQKGEAPNKVRARPR